VYFFKLVFTLARQLTLNLSHLHNLYSSGLFQVCFEITWKTEDIHGMLNWSACHKDVWKNSGTIPLVLNHDIRCRWSDSVVYLPQYQRGRSAWWTRWAPGL